MSLLQQVLDVAIPAVTFLLMIVVGIDLTVQDFRKVQAKPRALLIGTLGHYILPVVALLILSLMNLRSEIAGGLILLASAPAWW
jgi:bile acid:Na+ symporter, BASS family